MGWLILFIFIGIPLIELSVLIEVGENVGALSTVMLCLLTAAIGLSLIRMQGLKAIADLQQANASSTPVVEPLVHGFFLLIAGILLFFPGFVTDTLGALLLIPPIRLLLGRAGLAHATARGTSGVYCAHHTNHDPTTNVIEGEFWEANEQETQHIDRAKEHIDAAQSPSTPPRNKD